MNESKYSEQFYAQDIDSNDYQIEIELEDGPSALDPEKLTVVVDGKRKTVDVPRDGVEDHYKKAIELGLKELGRFKLMEGKISDMNEGKYPRFVQIKTMDDYNKFFVPTYGGDILGNIYQFSELENAWWEIEPEEESKIQPKSRLKSMRQILNSEFEPKFIYTYRDALSVESAAAYISEEDADPSDYGVREDDLYESKAAKCQKESNNKGHSMKIKVKEMKRCEAISSKLQDRIKFKEFATFLKELPFFGQTIGETVETLRKEGLGYGTGGSTRKDQEDAAKDILSDFSDYVSWEIKKDEDQYYIQMTFKPELWKLELEDLKKVFSLLDEAFGPYC